MIPDYKAITSRIFEISSNDDFRNAALEIFHLQSEQNEVYKKYLSALNFKRQDIREVSQIPFLPIEFFKTYQVITKLQTPDSKLQIFTSSGTTGSEVSKHFVSDISLYEKSFRKAFEYFYGDVTNYCILALMPSYLEREGSSLVYMINDLIKESKHEKSGFYLYNIDTLSETLKSLQEKNQETILFGVAYALLDFIEEYSFSFPGLIVMETGGMKGKRKELVREELHQILCKGFGVEKIYSEYGMTEILSQAYSKGNGIFKTPPWMKILIRDVNDPASILSENKTGGINIIDLANIYSCSFIATQDLGKLHADGAFEVLGRFDESDIRGCNLMIE